jgi:hypothetical protein
MTPKEKAKELVEKMYGVTDYQAKRSALIAVDLVILNCYEEDEYYWKEVKEELQKL